jgi:hypothetical protein
MKTWIALLALLALTLPVAGCATSASAEPPPPTVAPAPDLLSLAEWDVVWISDSTGFNAAEVYASLIEEDLGVTVRLHDVAMGGLPARRVLQALRGDEDVVGLMLNQLPDLIREAEVVVFYANPAESDAGDWNCVGPVFYVNDCSPEAFDQYRADLDEIYESIFALRGDAPVAVRAYDAYMPIFTLWEREGVRDACSPCWENYNQVIREAAAAHDVPLAEVYAAYNGPDHTEDPRGKGYISEDGEHPSEAGDLLIAQLLHELGYEPTTP